MVTITDIILMIKNWASSRNELKEIYLTGSQSARKPDERLDTNSDIDFIIIFEGDEKPTWIYSELAQIGLKIGKLIHPLVLSTIDFEIKMKIANYRRAISSGKKIYPKN